jgi:hypothetical protein
MNIAPPPPNDQVCYATESSYTIPQKTNTTVKILHIWTKQIKEFAAWNLYFTLTNPFLSGKLKFGKGSNNSYVSVLAPDFYMQDFTALGLIGDLFRLRLGSGSYECHKLE